MKEIKTKDAVGHVISHDITQIIPGEIKDVLFKKGHVVREEDIEALMKVGKMNLFVFENDESMVHENDAATVLADIVAPEDMPRSIVKEGKIEISAPADGVIRIDKQKLNALNSFDDIMVATGESTHAVIDSNHRPVVLKRAWPELFELLKRYSDI